MCGVMFDGVGLCAYDVMPPHAFRLWCLAEANGLMSLSGSLPRVLALAMFLTRVTIILVTEWDVWFCMCIVFNARLGLFGSAMVRQ